MFDNNMELELREKLVNLQTEMESIMNAGQEEKRELAENETSRMAEIRKEMDSINEQLAAIAKENENLAKQERNNKENNSKKTMKEIRLFDLINGVVNNNLTDEQRAYVKGNNTISTRGAIQATVEGAGQENVPEDKKSLDLAIRNASVLSKMGATWFGNAVGDISIPRYAGSQVGWKGEIAAADDGASAFTETILSPKRLTAYVDVSRQFLLQDSNDAEAILIRDLADAIAEKFDKTIFGTGTGDTNTPAGIFADTAYTITGSDLTGVTYDDVLALEEKVEEQNGSNFMFIANPAVKYKLKGTQMASGLEMVYSGKEIDGYPALVSNSVNPKSLVCMDPRDLAVATWNGVEVQVDTTTRAIYGEVRLVVNFYCDAKLRGKRISAEIFN